jgi:hypothetical protein
MVKQPTKSAISAIPPAADPHDVAETYSNGPINCNIAGPCATLTFTALRGDIDGLLHNRPDTPVRCVVVARVVLPNDALVQLRDLLNRMIQPVHPAGTA